MPSKRTSRRNQMGDSNASTDSSIGDKSKKFRCVMQRIVDKDQSLASPFNAAHDSLRKRVDKVGCLLDLDIISVAALLHHSPLKFRWLYGQQIRRLQLTIIRQLIEWRITQFL